MKLEAYFDESGIAGDARYCVMMGFVGTSQKWSLFEKGWESAAEGVPFHAKRFFGRDKQGGRLDEFRGWSDEQASRYLRRILDVIAARVAQGALTPIGTVVDVAAFDAVLEHALPKRDHRRGPPITFLRNPAARVMVGRSGWDLPRSGLVQCRLSSVLLDGSSRAFGIRTSGPRSQRS